MSSRSARGDTGIVVNIYSNVKSRVADRDPHLFWKLDADPL